MTMDSLDAISRFFKGWFTVQKYQENPLLIARDGEAFRKHDLRQYVLVESWEPLRVWFASEAYIRFAAQTYDLSDTASPGVHLTNTCVGKQIAGKDLQWTSIAYAEHLRSLYGHDVYTDVIVPQMKQIVMTSIACVQESMQQRHAGHAYEMLGYDFCVSQDFKVWLLEVNEMPALEYDTPATERVVSAALRDIARILSSEPCTAADGFFTLLINEPPIPPVPTLHSEFILQGIGYNITATGAMLRSAAQPITLEQNLGVKDFLGKIAMRKQKDDERKQARLRRIASTTRIVLNRIKGHIPKSQLTECAECTVDDLG